MSTSSDHVRLLETERDLLLEKLGRIDLQLAEGAWTGSMGGHDPDFLKLKGGLRRFWIEKAAKDPHPFTYCVRHLRKHVANPERLCAWLKDQALGTTKWRKGNKKIGEAAASQWEPSTQELREALMAYEEAAREAGIWEDEGGSAGADGTQGDEGREAGDTPPAGGDGSAEGSEAGSAGATAPPEHTHVVSDVDGFTPQP